MFWLAAVIVALALFTVTAVAVLWLAPRVETEAGWIGWGARALQAVVVLAAVLVGTLLPHAGGSRAGRPGSAQHDP
jgi:hypothetical protein